MSVEEEYEEYRAFLTKSREGERLLSLLPKAIEIVYKLLVEAGRENSMVQGALSWMSERDFRDLLGKNILLLCGRVFMLAKKFDSLEPSAKLDKVLNVLSIVKEEQEAWLEEYHKRVVPLPDKAARRKRREAFFLQENIGERREAHLCEEWIKGLSRYLVPQGTRSLFLPALARFFISHDFVDTLMQKHKDAIMQSVHKKEWKEALYVHVLMFVFQDVFVPPKARPLSQQKVSLPDPLFKKAVIIVTWLLELLSTVDPVIRFLPKEETAHMVCERLLDLLSAFSLESLLIRALPKVLFENVSSHNLDYFIDKVSGDPQAIVFLLKKIVALKGSSFAFSQHPSFGELFAAGVKGAVIEVVLKEKAESLVYNEIPISILEHIRYFLCSTFFDRMIYRSISI